MQTTKALDKYLTHYAEPCSRAISTDFIAGCKTYQHCVVIPCYNESTAFIRRLQATAFQQQPVLAIIVLNQPASQRTITRLNHRILQYLHQHFRLSQQHGLHTLFTAPDAIGTDILLINYCEPGLPAKQGVGLARKIGCDSAVKLMHGGKLTGQWLHSTDADATLPVDYFAIAHEAPVAATYRFTHQFLKRDKSATEQALETASRQYEQRLHYYQQGLAYAGSPYAFYTIGSALAFKYLPYCQVRGFPRRAAGEDFYLLNKLAKLGQVASLPQIITLTPRASARVPFGTGPATRALLTSKQRYDYDPNVFVALKEWLQKMPSICEQLFNTATINYETLPTTTVDALAALGINSLWQHIGQQKLNPEQATIAAHHWFDGFKTLKFIHYLTHFHYPKVCTSEIAQSQQPFAMTYTISWPDH